MAAAKLYPGQNSPITPAPKWRPLTPHDVTNFDPIPKAIHNGSATGGTFVAVGEDDVTATFYMAPGQTLPIQPKRINSTSFTSGMAIVGLND